MKYGKGHPLWEYHHRKKHGKAKPAKAHHAKHVKKWGAGNPLYDYKKKMGLIK